MPRSKNVESYPTVWLKVIHAVELLDELPVRCKSRAEALERRNQFYAYLNACDLAEGKMSRLGDMKKAAEYRTIATRGREIMVRLDPHTFTLLFVNRNKTEEVLDLSEQINLAVGDNVPDTPFPAIEFDEDSEQLAKDVLRISGDIERASSIHAAIEMMNKSQESRDTANDAPDPEVLVSKPRQGSLDEFLGKVDKEKEE